MPENRSMVKGSLVEIESDYFKELLKDISYYCADPNDKNIGIIMSEYNKYGDSYFVGLIGLVNSIGDRNAFISVDKLKRIPSKPEYDILDYCENYCPVKCIEECKFYNYKK